ncbi:hypothetical protein FRC19_010674, partial [Serendipita sp. 401]
MPTLKTPRANFRKPEDGGGGRGATNGQNPTTPVHRGRGGGLGFIMTTTTTTTTDRTIVRNWNLSTRPLLKPIKFVRAAERLFEADPEELLQAHEIPPHPSDQLDPQTDRLAEVFEEDKPTRPATPSPQETETEIEIVQSTVTMVEKVGDTKTKAMEVYHEEVIAASTSNITTIDTLHISTKSQMDDVQVSQPATTNTNELFFVDTTGDKSSSLEVPLFERIDEEGILGEQSEPDEIILVPSPKKAASISSRHSAEAIAPSPITMATLSLDLSREEKFGLSKAKTNKSLLSFSIPKTQSRSTKVPLRARKEAKRKKRSSLRGGGGGGRDEAWRNELGNMFGFQDQRRKEGLRKGDSDLDVGNSTGEDEEIEAALDHGMDIDGYLDEEAMTRFAREMNKPQMSMQDVEIEVALRRGDYDSGSEEDSEEDEDEEVMELNEDLTVLLADGEGDDDDEDDEDWSSDDGEDEDMTPNASFATRLQRVRERTPRVRKSGHDCTWADRDEEVLDEMQ